MPSDDVLFSNAVATWAIGFHGIHGNKCLSSVRLATLPNQIAHAKLVTKASLTTASQLQLRLVCLSKRLRQLFVAPGSLLELGLVLTSGSNLGRDVDRRGAQKQ